MDKVGRQAGMKRCTKCGKLKDKSEFGKHSSRKNGLRFWCKKCECDYMHEYYRRNRKSVKKYYSYEACHRAVDGVKEKRCRKCRKWKALIDYHKKVATKDGVSAWCKECISNSRKQRLAVRN